MRTFAPDPRIVEVPAETVEVEFEELDPRRCFAHMRVDGIIVETLIGHSRKDAEAQAAAWKEVR